MRIFLVDERVFEARVCRLTRTPAHGRPQKFSKGRGGKAINTFKTLTRFRRAVKNRPFFGALKAQTKNVTIFATL